MENKNMQLKIAHLYPELLNLYGDRGNIIVLEKRCQWRGILAETTQIPAGDAFNFKDYDIIFIGGGSDREQQIVGNTLKVMKDDFKEYVEEGGACLAICGGYQLLGNFYMCGEEKIEGLGILDIETTRGEARMIGNVQIKADFLDKPILGFENHGGATNIKNYEPLGEVISGFGNNGESGSEGVHYKNTFGTYLHGPILPRNEHFADFLISRALLKKYGEEVELSPC
jgi:CobQ-like glutamine amidotransferase family enzyme